MRPSGCSTESDCGGWAWAQPGCRSGLRPVPWAGGCGGRGGESGGDGHADADLGRCGERGHARPAGREAQPGLGRAVAVAVAVDVDAAAGQAGQGTVAVRGDRGSGQAGGGRPGPGGGDDGAARGGERDLAGVDGLAGALALAGRTRPSRRTTAGAMATGLQNTTRSPPRIVPASAAISADRPSFPGPRPAGQARSATRTATIPALPSNSRPASSPGAVVTSGVAAGRTGAASRAALACAGTLAGSAAGMSKSPGNEAPWLVRILSNPHC
jgi:hypothetical protein